MRPASAFLASATLLSACGGRVLDVSPQTDAGATVPDASPSPQIDSSSVADGSSAHLEAASTDAATPDAASLLDPSPCLIGGNVFYAGQVLAGVPSAVTLQSPVADFGVYYHSPGYIEIAASGPASSSQDERIDFTGPFRGNDGGGGDYTPLQVGTYGNAGEFIGSTLSPGQPGLSLVINTIDCGVAHGTFVITSLDVDPTGTVLHGLTLAFEAQCGPPLEQDFGCVHLENLFVIVDH
jgi:hypothetical protein